MTEAQVVVRHDEPVLEVDGKPVAPLMVFVNPTSGDWQRGLSTVRRAAAAGINIVSFVNHDLPMPRAGEEANYASWDGMIDAIPAAKRNRDYKNDVARLAGKALGRKAAAGAAPQGR